MMNILVVPYWRKPAAVDAAFTITAWLERQGIASVMSSGQEGIDQLSNIAEPDGRGAHGYDLVVSLGGDGTILRCARLVGYSEIPLLGYNFGRLGFLAGAPSDALIPTLVDALAGELHQQRHVTLRVELEFADGTTISRFALNEVTVSRNSFDRVADFDLVINGIDISHIRSDGIIVATPTGSTAYALSAGGPLISPNVAGMVVVPLAAHTLAARSIVVGSSDVVEVIPHQEEKPTNAFLDGELVCSETPLVRVSVSRGEGDIVLLEKGGSEQFYRDISRIFFRGGGSDD
jgi:NAD+ kinase